MGERAHTPGREYTPGPWRLAGAVIRGTKASGQDRPIVEVYRRIGGVDHEAIANANICVAAPDMFEAIKAALDSAVLFGRAGDEAISKEAMSALRAALSKASPAPAAKTGGA